MNHPTKLIAGAAGGLLVGAIGFLLLGSGPRSVGAGDLQEGAWEVPAYSAPNLLAAESVWGQRRPWGGGLPAESGEQASRDEAMAARPVGVALEAGVAIALFQQPGQSLLRVAEGDELPAGGRVTGVSQTRVQWIDADGQARERHFFSGTAAQPPIENE